ncbi:glycoside hydrolase family 3 N-terminal domain-containing protein [Gordonia sp. (in: high G+C Gram-positive bacteria)]|uniref:glycoside hydrolase family 3 N-terminal domain-containing protein n=1 Tax=Gordonia sp. (in: high G+C Gram-positive bacteria) TaxID=84139 RepID=UPI00169CEE52|nr:glycoside hydrolase family 3 N-terminal domain-containing protein [Gordonia sp. (in: high G+C Gram-positive bacteria)]NLG47855.1 glycoside hydrolase family 3 protein [Gordonia sp. (in: high G+C Gram-positive bacteria)]
MGHLTRLSSPRVGAGRALLALAAAAGLFVTTACSNDPAQESATASSSTVASASKSSAPASSSAASKPAACGADELKKLSLREKLAQMLVVGVTDAADARQIVKKEKIGGVFVGSWTDLTMLTDGSVSKLSKSRDIPLMVTVDQEGGRVNRLKDLGIDLPSARVMGETMTAEQVRKAAKSAGQKMAKLGITVDFAPSADVSDEPDDAVIGDRSFSNDPEKVTEYAGAFAKGLEEAGIMPVYKHFPGHGHGSGDSHLGAVVTPPLAELQNSDLVPFRELLKDPGNAGVMVGHLIVPGLTGPETPASISPAAIGMLRSGKKYDAPRFNGVVFTDDLSGMKAITDKYSIEQAVLKSITAGSDVGLWLSTDRVSSVLDTLEKAVKGGKLSTARVDRSVVRILKAKGVLRCS